MYRGKEYAMDNDCIVYDARQRIPAAEEEVETIQEWKGKIILYSVSEELTEAKFIARGSAFDVLLGRMQFGTFLCIPNWQVGVSLAPLNNVFHNREILEGKGSLCPVDAISVAYGLRALYERGIEY